jgi:hypothetical protein
MLVLRALLITSLINLCSCGSDDPVEIDASRPPPSCSSSEPGYEPGDPEACDWSFSCSHVGSIDTYALHCDRLSGHDYTCTCMINEIQGGTIRLPYACFSGPGVCESANSACGWNPLVECP